MAMAYNTRHLTTHEGISDAIYRFVYGLDDGDSDLIKSAFTPDAVFDATAMAQQGSEARQMHGLDSILQTLEQILYPLDSTHMVSNIRTQVSAENPRRAKATAYALAQHWRPGHGLSHLFGQDYMCGNRYDVDLVFDGEIWRIEKLRLAPAWAKGDPGVMDSKSWGKANGIARGHLEKAKENWSV